MPENSRQQPAARNAARNKASAANKTQRNAGPAYSAGGQAQAIVNDVAAGEQPEWLAEEALPTVQRQEMAAEIGRVAGNRHLGQILDAAGTVPRSPDSENGLPAAGNSNSLPVVQRQGAAEEGLEENQAAFNPERRFDEELADLKAQARAGRAADPPDSEAAVHGRAALLMSAMRPATFESENDLMAFVEKCENIAEGEERSLIELGKAMSEPIRAFPELFPEMWSVFVDPALDLELDTPGWFQKEAQAKENVASTLERVPEQILEEGLPLTLGEALGLPKFEIDLKHLDMEEDHIVKDYARALFELAQQKAALHFCTTWAFRSKNIVDDIREGKQVVVPADYDLLLTQRETLQEFPERIARVSDRDEAIDLLGKLGQVELGQFSIHKTITGLDTFKRGTEIWKNGKAVFDSKLTEANMVIRGESYWARVKRALQWAFRRGYIGAAVKRLWDEILAHPEAVLAKMLLMIGALVLVQFVPGLNIVVNLILWALGVSAAVQMLGDVLNALEVAGNAGSVLTLQKGSAQMAILSSEALQALLEFITFKVLKGGIGKIADKVRERRAKDKDLSPQQAVEEEVGKAEGQTTTGKPPAAGVDEGLPKGEPAKAGKTAKEGEAAKEAEEVTSRQPVPAPTSLAERAEEFSDARLWSEVAEQTQKDFAGPATRLSARSLEYNRKVLMMMITKSEASVERARAARARVEIKLREAEAATDGDVIYRKLREAAAEVNKLHDKEVVQLQTHHEEWVSHHPATFPKTRAERIRARIRRRIKNGVANLSREERAIAGIADREKRIGVIREWAKAKLEHDVESGPAKLEEVEMDVLTREAHLSEVHGSH